MPPNRAPFWRRLLRMTFVFALAISCISLRALGNDSKSLTAVAPARGRLTKPELKAVVIEIRNHLRYHGAVLAIQKDVRGALTEAAVTGAPTTDQLTRVSDTLGAGRIIVPVVSENRDGSYDLLVLLFDSADANKTKAVKSKLPSRGAAPYGRKEVAPATAAIVAFLLGKHPDPAGAPFPSIRKVDPYRLIKVLPPTRDSKKKVRSVDSKSKTKEQREPQKPQDVQTTKDKGKKHKWDDWQFRGLFGEVGFMFSWCRQDGLCATTTKGYGARFRMGVRIMSFVALSISGIAVDHQMPITTNTEVFLNVESAFVFAGFFGGLRVHPVRRFLIDPFVGLDFGNIWLLYSENTTVEPDASLPAAVAANIGSARREVIYLRGFTLTPEMGFNIFLSKNFAFGFHVQWLIPFWKNTCVQVYNPTLEGLKNTAQVCTAMKSLKSNEKMDDLVAEKLSNKDNLPRFVSIELDLMILFQ